MPAIMLAFFYITIIMNTIVYLDKPGKHNTSDVLQIVKERIKKG